VVDAEGRPIPQYHWTDSEFTEFDTEGTQGAHFGTKDAALDRARGMDQIDYEIDKDEDGYFVYADSGPMDGEGQGPFKTKREAQAFVDSQPSTIPPMSVYLSMSNPVRVPDLGVWSFDAIRSQLVRQDTITTEEADAVYDAWRNGTDPDGWAALRKAMAANGYHGIVYKNEHEDAGSDSYVALSPTQIKPATGNTGAFSPDNPARAVTRRWGGRWFDGYEEN